MVLQNGGRLLPKALLGDDACGCQRKEKGLPRGTAQQPPPRTRGMHKAKEKEGHAWESMITFTQPGPRHGALDTCFSTQHHPLSPNSTGPRQPFSATVPRLNRSCHWHHHHTSLPPVWASANVILHLGHRPFRTDGKSRSLGPQALDFSLALEGKTQLPNATWPRVSKFYTPLSKAAFSPLGG